MNKYESIIIINPNIVGDELKKVISKMQLLKENMGKVENVKEIGKKKLAYPIKNNTEGYYVLFEFEVDSNNVSEIERVYRITEEIMKFIIVRKTEE